jgi:hypothetical protein
MFQTFFEWFIMLPSDYMEQEDEEDEYIEYDEVNDYIRLTDGR